MFQLKRPYHSKRNRSKRSEKSLAKKLGGRVQPASGALPVASLKGDVVTDRFCVDDKTTLSASFSVKVADIRKIERQAFQMRRLPVMSVQFENYGNTRVYVLTELAFNTLVNHELP